MRLKLDENLGATWINGLRDRGHDVDTVSDEGMGGAFDADVLAAATGATRALVTLDLYFSNPFRFPPEATAGIVVLRVSDRPGRVELEAVLKRLCTALEIGDPTRQLWVVDARRVRQFDPPT